MATVTIKEIIDKNDTISNTPFSLDSITTEEGQYFIYSDVDLKFESAFDLLKDDAAIVNSLWTMFNTKVGERVMNPTFGSSLDSFLFENITYEMLELIHLRLSNLLSKVDPRIKLTNLKIYNNPHQENVIDIVIEVTIAIIGKTLEITISQPVQ